LQDNFFLKNESASIRWSYASGEESSRHYDLEDPMQLGTVLKDLRRPALLCVSLLLLHPLAPAQDTAAAATQASTGVTSDAQIEANVLKALAGAPELADQNITTTTVYGVVTLSGTVRDEATRTLAETLASRAAGVKKVIGELTLGTGTTAAAAAPDQPQDATATGTNPNLQSDGTMAPAAQPNQENMQPPSQTNAPVARQTPPNQRPYPAGPYGPPPGSYPQGEPYGAQQAGLPVVIPSGAMVRIRINQGLDSKRAQPGNTFDGTVLNDVVADGAVAIPRGASVQGSVMDAKASGALSGRGELSLQLTQVILAGKVYPVVSDHWSSVGADKTLRTVNSAIGLGAMGAIIGAVAGGGPGAAIGAGVGGAAGVGTSAASGGGQALIPPEAILTFHLAQPAQVATVSQAEMDRLGYGVPVGSQPRLVRRPRPAYYGYYGPGPYPAGPYPAYYPYPY
jgi:hypothetical protein